MVNESTAGRGYRLLNRILNWIEIVGNKLPDPAVLFVVLLVGTWLLSWPLSGVAFDEQHPQTHEPIRIVNQMTGPALAHFLSHMVETFTGFHPLGVVLVALLGVGVAESTGFINAVLKWLLGFTPDRLLTPMLIFVAIVSHTAADAGYVLVIPLGGVIFYAAGRHPLAGIAAAFAGVSGGFSANFIPSGIDPLLQGLTQSGAQVLDPDRLVNPLCNWYFTAASSVLVILVGWVLTDWVVEPRLKATAVDGDSEDMPHMHELNAAERRGLFAGLFSMVVGLVLLALWTLAPGSAMRSPHVVSGVVELAASQAVAAEVYVPAGAELAAPGDPDLRFRTKTDCRIAAGQQSVQVDITAVLDGAPERYVVDAGAITEMVEPILGIRSVRNLEATALNPDSDSITAFSAPIMQSIVPLIFLMFLVPGVVYGYVSGSARSHRDIIKGMSHAMSAMGYYLVMAFFAALFIEAFKQSNVGILLALKGANFLRALGMPGQLTIVGIICLTAMVNLLVGSASAKWALLSPIFVPMLMQLGFSPELTQAAYRVGDSTTNIITPLMPYFPLVVVFCQRYVKGTGIGTVVSLMLPYSVVLFVTWAAFLLLYWGSGLSLGLQAPYIYAAV